MIRGVVRLRASLEPYITADAKLLQRRDFLQSDGSGHLQLYARTQTTEGSRQQFSEAERIRKSTGQQCSQRHSDIRMACSESRRHARHLRQLLKTASAIDPCVPCLAPRCAARSQRLASKMSTASVD